jgi:hypothetical protein
VTLEQELEIYRLTLFQIARHSKDAESRFRAKRALGFVTRVYPNEVQTVESKMERLSPPGTEEVETSRSSDEASDGEEIYRHR